MEDPIVQVQQGKLQGIKERNYNGNNYYAFRGIPYAKPPIGKLRFKDPEPAVSWSGIKSATKYGNKCAQINWFTRKIDGSDDCLYLNVFTMDLNPSEAKAVMFFIHPGNFSFGSGSDEIYGPDFIVEKDVVLVTINYRVGILGFLNVDDESASGNQGLKDQVMALKWVQQNIDKFGGDPNNVTIFGYSAGGSSVHYLSLSPLTQGLFHKAILQSGVATNPWATVPHSMKEKAIEISSILGNKITDSKQLVDYLQQTDVQLLLQAAASLLSWKNKYLNLNMFGPSVDHKSKMPFLSVPIEDAIKSGIKTPCIIGTTSHEAIITLAGLNEDNLSEIEANQDTLLLHPNVKCFLQRHNISVRQIKKFYMGDKKISLTNKQLFVDFLSATNFVINVHHIIDIERNNLSAPTYFYRFDYYSKDTSTMQKILRTDLEGTCHCEESGFFFNMKFYKKIGIEPPAPGTTEYFIQKNFLELWTTFAKTGNPNPQSPESISIEWKPIDNNPTEHNCLEISKDLRMIKEKNLLYQFMNNV